MSRNIETISNSSSTWRSIKSRYVLGVSSLALAAGLILGVSALKTSGATPQTQPTFANAADAEEAGRALGTARPMFANAVDAEEADRSFALGSMSTVGLPMFATEADAAFAARSLVSVAELPHPQPVAPMFATAADAMEAGRALVPVAEYAQPFRGQSMFPTAADAEFAARGLVPEAALR